MLYSNLRTISPYYGSNNRILDMPRLCLLHCNVSSAVSGESRRGGEGRMLEDLEKQVLKIYETCVGENQVINIVCYPTF